MLAALTRHQGLKSGPSMMTDCRATCCCTVSFALLGHPCPQRDRLYRSRRASAERSLRDSAESMLLESIYMLTCMRICGPMRRVVAEVSQCSASPFSLLVEVSACDSAMHGRLGSASRCIGRPIFYAWSLAKLVVPGCFLSARSARWSARPGAHFGQHPAHSGKAREQFAFVSAVATMLYAALRHPEPLNFSCRM